MVTVSLKPFPVKFRSALALANDTDDMTLSKHNELVSTFRSFGLAFADSFWCFSNGPQSDFTYFEGMDAKSFRYKDAILEGLRDGTIDTLHSWGNFPGGGFRRSHAEQALEEMKRHNVSVSVLTSHGAHGNSHNIMCDGSFGDIPGHAHYTCDLLKKLGIEFVWNYELSPVPGQSAHVSDHDYYKFSHAPRHLRTASYVAYELHKVTGSRLLYRASSKFCSPPLPDNHLLTPATARDGTEFIQFKRYGAWQGTGPFSLARNFSEQSLQRLVSSGGISILYAHFARMKLDKKEISTIERIARLQQDKSIFVATTSELLARSAYAKFLKPEVVFHGKKAIVCVPRKITSNGLNLPVRADWVLESIEMPFPGISVEVSFD